jgi:outer membrane scaffolding protein for murein synthesis (MipA/OmpV family)
MPSSRPVLDRGCRALFLARVRDGIGVNVIRDEWLTLAPVLRYRFGRDQDDNRALFGMGDVNGAIEGGLLGDAADSPIVRDATQAFFGHGITWRGGL